LILLNCIMLKKNIGSKRGGFRRDGSSHYAGISREQLLIQLLSDPRSSIRQAICNSIGLPIPSGSTDSNRVDVRHVGGTNTKVDVAMYCSDTKQCLYSISVKNHQGKSGTFDWMNTSKGFPELETCMASLRQIKDAFINTEESLRNVDAVRTQIDGVFSDILERTRDDSEFIRGILANIYEHNPDGMVVFLGAKNQVVHFHKSELAVLRESANPTNGRTYSLKHKPNTTSAQIMYTDPNQEQTKEHNSYMRIRLVLNNGVTAFLGLSDKNKTSVPCIKIQQDSVDALMGRVANKQTETFTETTTVTIVEVPIPEPIPEVGGGVIKQMLKEIEEEYL